MIKPYFLFKWPEWVSVLLIKHYCLKVENVNIK